MIVNLYFTRFFYPTAKTQRGRDLSHPSPGTVKRPLEQARPDRAPVRRVSHGCVERWAMKFDGFGEAPLPVMAARKLVMSVNRGYSIGKKIVTTEVASALGA
jgi:hypothetical protein